MRQYVHRYLILFSAVLFALYLAIAYFILPNVWSAVESRSTLINNGALTFTKQGIPADPINFGVVGTEDEVVRTIRLAGWYPADAVTLKSSLGIARSVVFNKPYVFAPVSPLFYQGRKQALAFEKPSGKSAKTRHHARLWKVLDQGSEQRPLWVGAATFDQSVGVSHLTGQITHHISGDIDAERDFLIGDLTNTKMITVLFKLVGVGPTKIGHNGGGDRYHTDGEIRFAIISPGAQEQKVPPQFATTSPIVRFANSLWASAVQMGGPR